MPNSRKIKCMGNEEKRSFMSFNSRDFKGFTFRSGPVKNQVKQNSTFGILILMM